MHRQTTRLNRNRRMLLQNNKPEWPCIGRNENLKAFYDWSTERQKQRNESDVPADKGNNPLFAVQCAPGGGKSFFLDKIAGCEKIEDLSVCKDENTKERLKNGVSVSITYNSGTNRIPADESDPELGLALRLLFV